MAEFFSLMFSEILSDINENIGLVLRLVLSCLCGGFIGFERSKRQKDAGIRTHLIVALGSALAMIVSKYGFFDLLEYEGLRADASRIASNVITGVGFLGAGVIFVRDVSIKGLTTAAGIWATAAVGLAIGSGMYTIGIVSTLLMIVLQLILHRYLSKLENTVNEFTVVVNDVPGIIQSFQDKLKEKNMAVETCKLTRKSDSTIELDITVKKSRTTSMDEIMLLGELDENIVSIDI